MSAAEIIQLATRGEPDATRFCHAWTAFCHLVDDLVDESERPDAHRITSTFLSFILELEGNPWFQPRKAMFIGLMVQAVNYWLESNNRQGAERDILKAYWHAVVYQVAFCVDGFQHMRHVTSETLEFDYEDTVIVTKGQV